MGNIPMNQVPNYQKQINISDIQNLSPKALLNQRLEAGGLGPGVYDVMGGSSPPQLGAAAAHNLSENSHIAGNSSGHFPFQRNSRKKYLREMREMG